MLRFYFVKIIIILRNPIDRAYSAFQHVSRGFKEQNLFEESLEIEDGRLERDRNLTPMVMYKDMGMYHEMVKSYQENFSNVHVIIFDDFSYNTENQMKKIYQFLGISDKRVVNKAIRASVSAKLIAGGPGTSWNHSGHQKTQETTNKNQGFGGTGEGWGV